MGEGKETDGRSAHRYWPNYCEENIYWLLDRIGGQDCYAVFITGRSDVCRFWRQMRMPRGVVSWDYHVVAAQPGTPSLIWDFDSALEFPSDGATFVAETFHGWARASQPLFRAVPRDEFLLCFTSDRSHMHSKTGGFMAPPPPWKPICHDYSNLGSNLSAYLDKRSGSPGRLLANKRDFLDWLGVH